MRRKSPVKKLQAVVDAKPGLFLYVTLAKAGLWFTSFVLLLLVTTGTIHFVRQTRTDPDAVALASMMVQASQVIVVIAISVLGYHGYQGTHILHSLRQFHAKT